MSTALADTGSLVLPSAETTQRITLPDTGRHRERPGAISVGALRARLHAERSADQALREALV